MFLFTANLQFEAVPITVHQLVEVFELVVDEVVELLAEFLELLVPLLMCPNIGFLKHELIAVALLRD